MGEGKRCIYDKGRGYAVEKIVKKIGERGRDEDCSLQNSGRFRPEP